MSLVEAAGNGCTDMVRKLLVLKADVHTPESCRGDEKPDGALRRAARCGHSETLRVLLEHKANVHVDLCALAFNMAISLKVGARIVDLLLEHVGLIDNVDYKAIIGQSFIDRFLSVTYDDQQTVENIARCTRFSLMDPSILRALSFRHEDFVREQQRLIRILSVESGFTLCKDLGLLILLYL